jgi:hypothetical protein
MVYGEIRRRSQLFEGERSFSIGIFLIFLNCFTTTIKHERERKRNKIITK